MKRRYVVWVATFWLTWLAIDPAQAASNGYGLGSTLTLSAGVGTIGGASLSNGELDYVYGGAAMVSPRAELGWQLPLVHSILGSLWVGETLSYMGFQGAATAQGPGMPSSLWLSVLGLDTAAIHQWDFFPWKPLVPFIGGGLLSTGYFQTGSSQDFCGGMAFNPEANAGFLLWLSREGGTFPAMALTGKVERVFTALGSSPGVALNSTIWLAGLGISI